MVKSGVLAGGINFPRKQGGRRALTRAANCAILAEKG